MERTDLDELRRSVSEGRAAIDRSRATLAKVRRILAEVEVAGIAPGSPGRDEGGRSGGTSDLVRQGDRREAG